MRFLDYLNEAGLGGKSRSGGMSNWEHYIVKNFDKNLEHEFDSDAKLYNQNLDIIGDVKKGESLKILSPGLIIKNKSNFANILYKNNQYLVNINSIKKPIETKSGNVIPGGSNSKEFTPDKLEFNGKTFSSASELAKFSVDKINFLYKDTSYLTIRKYLMECLSLVTGQNYLIESYKKSFSIKNVYNIGNSDIKILSKNFGEILASIFILKTNKKAKNVTFPSDISQQLYDFYIETDKGKHFYSVKSLGGSSTSMENINFILKHFSKDNIFFIKYKNEIDTIMSLINNREAGQTTIRNIENFFLNKFPNKIDEIVRLINFYTPTIKIRNISQSELNKWFLEMVKLIDLNKFTELMNKVYNNILGDIGKTPKTSEKVLEDMYKVGDGSKFANGYLYYPMGSYITNYLNEKGNYKFVLNELLNYGNFITQIEVNLKQTEILLVVSTFKKSEFRFTYNGMSKAPGNRPIGFKSV